MRFFTTAVSFALVAFTTLASAQVPTKANAITHPIAGETIVAGETYDITWMNTVGSKVTLILVDGPANQLMPVATIVASANNNGVYSWTVPEDIPASSTYAIRISYDSNPNNYNYSDRFTFSSDVTATPTVSTASSTSAPTTSASSSTESITSTVTESSISTSESTSTETGTTTLRASTSSRRTSTSSAPTSTNTSGGAPQSAANPNLSSPLAVIMAVLAAALFIH